MLFSRSSFNNLFGNCSNSVNNTGGGVNNFVNNLGTSGLDIFCSVSSSVGSFFSLVAARVESSGEGNSE